MDAVIATLDVRGSDQYLERNQAFDGALRRRGWSKMPHRKTSWVKSFIGEKSKVDDLAGSFVRDIEDDVRGAADLAKLKYYSAGLNLNSVQRTLFTLLSS